METKMKDIDAAPHVYPGGDPPPYSGPSPGVSNQPQVTVVHPGHPTVIQTNTVVPAIIVASNMGPGPSPFVCRSCNQQIVTRVERISSTRTHIFAVVLCLIGCWPCVCIPYCTDSCKSANHYCPNCNAYIGSYNS